MAGTKREQPPPEWYTPGEVAAMLSLNPKTINRWTHEGRFPDDDHGRPGAIKLPNGHHRYRRSVVDRMLEGEHAQV